MNKCNDAANYKIIIVLLCVPYVHYRIHVQSVLHHNRLYPSFNAKIHRILLEKPSVFCMQIFTYTISVNDSFFLNFLISPENRSFKI